MCACICTYVFSSVDYSRLKKHSSAWYVISLHPASHASRRPSLPRTRDSALGPHTGLRASRLQISAHMSPYRRGFPWSSYAASLSSLLLQPRYRVHGPRYPLACCTPLGLSVNWLSELALSPYSVPEWRPWESRELTCLVHCSTPAHKILLGTE